MTPQTKAFVPGYAHDIFVSYACVDDLPSGKGQLGWVSQLVEDIKTRLAQKLGRSDIFSIWQDVDMSRNEDLGVQISLTLERTATLLVVLSPGYLASDWCRREREAFLKFIHRRLESGSRVFLVIKEELERQEDRPQEFGKPDEFVNLLGYKFWTRDRNVPPRPLDPSRATDIGDYRDLVNRLVYDLAENLKTIRKDAEKQSVGKRDTQAPVSTLTVFLAEVTDDLRSRRSKVSSYLEQFGVQVLPTDSLPTGDLNALDASLKDALSRCQAFVQLLSVWPGKSLRGTNKTLALFQHQRAADVRLPIYQWRDPNLSEEVFDKQVEPDGDVDLVAFRALLFGPTVQATNLEDFKSQVQQLLNRPVKPQPKAPGMLGGSMVFVHFHSKTDDRALAEALAGYLEQHGYAVVKTYEGPDADPQLLRQEFENSVLESHGLILVYGDQRAHLWARGQLREINKLICEHKRSLQALAVGVGPPRKESNLGDPLGFRVPNMQVLDLQDWPDDLERLRSFLDALDHIDQSPSPTKPTAMAT